jgi:hypothetical protein
VRALLVSVVLAAVLASSAFAQEAATDAMAGMDHMRVDGGGMTGLDHARGVMGPVVGMAGVSGSLGFYPYAREAPFGTAWQPESTPRSGVRAAAGDWLLIGSADLQVGGGGRGLGSGYGVFSARHDFDNGDVLQARIRATPGVITPALEELTASYAHRLSNGDTLFVYAGPRGQPAFGPPSGQDRLSRGGDPLRPPGIEILASDGVVTGGWSHGEVRLEGSAFNGAAPPLNGLQAQRLDAWSARLSLAPAPDWSLQASYAGLRREDRGSLSAIFAHPLGETGWWAATAALAWGRLDGRGGQGRALLEAAVSPDGLLTLYGRVERGAQALGAERDWPLARRIALGFGGEYASDGSLGFVRLRWR